jgi:hypothetical protein
MLCLASRRAPTRRISRASGLASHFVTKTKMLVLTIMAIKSSQTTFPFHVGFNTT